MEAMKVCLQARAVNERTFGSDSGLEQSGDELEVQPKVEANEAESDAEDLNVALEEDTEEEEETSESLETGDLGVDRATTFRVEREEPPLDMELEALEEELAEPLPNEDEEEEEDETPVGRKHREMGISEEEAITNMLSELSTGPSRVHGHEMSRR